MGRVFIYLLQLRGVCLDVLHSRFLSWTKPLTPSLLLETLADLGRSKAELIAENALLRQQLIILSRQVKRPACSRSDRTLLVLLARLVRTWQQALFIVQPETLLRWHRDLLRLVWKRMRLLTGHRSLLSTALRFLHHRIEVTEGHPRRRDKISDRSLGSATPTGSHPVWASTEVFDL